MDIWRLAFVVSLCAAVACGSAGTEGDGGDTDDDPSQSGPQDGGGGDDDDGAPSPGGNGGNTGDKPAVAGNGVCETGEDPQNTPADCPSVLGDGLCTAGETFINAEADCPPPDLTITSQTRIAEVLASNPVLRFGRLSIQATLYLEPATPYVFRAESIGISGSGSLSYEPASNFDQRRPPSITLESAKVEIAGRVYLRGAAGEMTSEDFNVSWSCDGTAGGDLLVNAQEITFTGEINVRGGLGNVRNLRGSTAHNGCRGGNGGSVRLFADTFVAADGKIEATGGFSGFNHWGSPEIGWDNRSMPSGNAGWVVASKMVRLSGLTPTSVLEFATTLGANTEILGTVHGSVKNTAGKDPWDNLVIIPAKRASGFNDTIEDLYRVRNSGSTPITYIITLSATSGASDIDLYVFNPNLSGVASGMSDSTSERIQLSLSPGQEILVGVNALFSSSTGYRLRLERGLL